MIGSVIVKRAQAFATENASTLLTGVGVAGTITTAVLTGRASLKAAEILNYNKIMLINLKDSTAEPEDISTADKVKLVWTEFIPPVGVGVVTITSIIYANRISAKQAAAMAAAYTLSEKSFSDYKKKVVDKLGVNKETDIRDQVAQERISANPPSNGSLIVVGDGDVLCYDVLTGRYFKSSVDKLKKAENEVNGDILTGDGASLSRFYDEIGLPQTPYSDTVGWNLDNRCELQLSTIMTDDDRPCVSIDFAGWPKPDYIKVWG